MPFHGEAGLDPRIRGWVPNPSTMHIACVPEERTFVGIRRLWVRAGGQESGSAEVVLSAWSRSTSSVIICSLVLSFSSLTFFWS